MRVDPPQYRMQPEAREGQLCLAKLDASQAFAETSEPCGSAHTLQSDAATETATLKPLTRSLQGLTPLEVGE